MNKIIVFRTFIQINDYTMGDSPKLESYFIIRNPIFFRDDYVGLVYNEEYKILRLPRGLDIYYLENIFKEKAVYEDFYHPYDKLGKVTMKYLPKDDVQKAALRFTLGVGEFEKNKHHSQLSLNLSTGKGKSYCAIATMVALDIKSIVITDSIDWLNQWKNFILEYTTISEKEICFISGSASINKLFKTSNPKYKIYLITHASIQGYASDNGWHTIGLLFNHLQIGLKFFDEAHLNFENLYNIDYSTSVYKTYYITATPGRSDISENFIFGLYFKNVPSIELFDQESDPHTEYIALRYNSHPTPLEVQNCKGPYGLDKIKYMRYLNTKESFFKIFYILISKATKIPGKHLFYIGLNEIILDCKKWIEDNFPSLINHIGVFTSITPEEYKKGELDKKIILSTTKSAGAAVDIPNLSQVIVLNEPFKSKIIAQQTFGRTRNINTRYIELVDTGFYFTKEYHKFKRSVFQKYATKCLDVNLDDKKLEDAYQKEIRIQSKNKDLVF